MEDLLAHIYDCRLTIEVIIANARPLSCRILLDEAYRLRRQLEILQKHVSAEWHYENGSDPDDA